MYVWGSFGCFDLVNHHLYILPCQSHLKLQILINFATLCQGALLQPRLFLLQHDQFTLEYGQIDGTAWWGGPTHRLDIKGAVVGTGRCGVLFEVEERDLRAEVLDGVGPLLFESYVRVGAGLRAGPWTPV